MRFWCRSDQNSGLHGNRYLLLGCNGENIVISVFLTVFDLSICILAGKDDIHKSLNEFEIWPDLTMDCGHSCP